MRRFLLVFASAVLASPAAGAVLGTEAGCYWHAHGDLPVDWQEIPLIVTDKTLTFIEVWCDLAAPPALDGSPVQAVCVEAGSEDEPFDLTAILRESADGTVSYSDHAYDLTLHRCE